MPALAEALYDVMAGSTELTALLGTFGGGPSILTQRPVPATAGYPIILAATHVSDNPRDLLTTQGREILRDVIVYGKAAAHWSEVHAAGEIVRDLFHRKRTLDVDGWRTVTVLASGPRDAPAEADEIGKVVTLDIRLLKEH